MQITHKEYLDQILYSRKLELKEVEVQNRIAIAEFNVKRKLLQEQIDSIESQLEKGIENKINT